MLSYSLLFLWVVIFVLAIVRLNRATVLNKKNRGLFWRLLYKLGQRL